MLNTLEEQQQHILAQAEQYDIRCTIHFREGDTEYLYEFVTRTDDRYAVCGEREAHAFLLGYKAHTNVSP